ncbi:YkgJ family cysteine cluster protein [Uliginosibacterium sediminicola]|uniref:YkgJ family cysteine cluster protein n=1 Tax=Uliginosibacterium sediminicola TaxID=2024550 RepID=A0ABU9Z3N1_9RHOO
MSSEDFDNPCIRCGACCSHFRVSFYWGEADDAPGGCVPAALTTQVTPHLRAMCGTHPHAVRCVALEGELGREVRCSIYAQRPSPCHDFAAWELDGSPNEACTRARAAHGLPPLPAIRAGASDAERCVG